MDQSQVVVNAYAMKNAGYGYVYGTNGEELTRSQVDGLIDYYDEHFTTQEIIDAARAKVGRRCVDCSSFCLLAMGINPTVNGNDKSANMLYNESPQKWPISERKYMQHGMFVWRSGHIGILNETNRGDGSLVIEATNEFEDIVENVLRDRINVENGFTHFGKFAGVQYASGYLDEVTPTSIAGWVWNGVNDTTIDVRIQIVRKNTNQTVFTTTTSANQYRADLKNAGIGNGKHAFSYPINFRNFGSGTYIVYAFMIFSGNPQLYNSPKEVTV